MNVVPNDLTKPMSSSREDIRNKTRDLSIVGTWEVENSIAVGAPAHPFQPHLWRWSEFRPLILQAAQTFTLKDAIRRVLIMSNPGVYPVHHTTNTLYVSCSVYNGGERAPVHKHTSNASRFVLEGSGGYTNIEGEKCLMHRGDLILTPNGAWHDHGNEGQDPVIWVDVLDLPLVESLGGVFFEFDMYAQEDFGSTRAGELKRFQDETVPIGYSEMLYGAGGLIPTFIKHQRGDNDLSTPMFVYRWTDTEAALNALRGLKGSPHDGIILEYVNPVTGGPVTRTLSFNVQMLRAGEKALARRRTGSTAYCCLRGHGETIIGDKRFEWGENDIFVVPSWYWCQHSNLEASEDAILYSVTDIPILKTLGIYREELA